MIFYNELTAGFGATGNRGQHFRSRPTIERQRDKYRSPWVVADPRSLWKTQSAANFQSIDRNVPRGQLFQGGLTGAQNNVRYTGDSVGARPERLVEHLWSDYRMLITECVNIQGTGTADKRALP